MGGDQTKPPSPKHWSDGRYVSAGTEWIDWGATNFATELETLMLNQPDCLIIVTNASEGSVVMPTLASASLLTSRSYRTGVLRLAGPSFAEQIIPLTASGLDFTVLTTIALSPDHHRPQAAALAQAYLQALRF